jgi:hypothetical protein
MRTVNNITKLFTVLVIIVGIISLTLLIVGVATRKWVSISTNLSTLETQISTALSNTTFITSLIIATQATQTQVVTIVSATAQLIEQQLINAVPNSTVTYNLYGKNPNLPQTSLSFKTAQGLIFTGIASIFVGLLLTLIVIILGLPSFIRHLPLFFLSVGPILLTIGFSLYPKTVIEDAGTGLQLSVTIGYSIILVITGTIVGYGVASLFALIVLQPLQNGPYTPRNFNAPPRPIFRPSYPSRIKRNY